MTYDISSFETQAKETLEWLRGEFASIRTGQATPALLDGVRVDSYGAKVPIQQVGSVGVEDARTLRLSVWDKDQIHAIERAILDADLGVSVSTDDAGLRVIFPELTSERREQLLKLAKQKLEDARVSLRAARDEIMKAIDAAEKAGEVSEDGKFNAKEGVQKKVEEYNKALNDLFDQKEKEISE